MFHEKREIFRMEQIISWKEHPVYCAIQTLIYFQQKILSGYV